jgi:hypothetical protein
MGSRALLMLAVVWVVVAILAPAAVAYGGPNPNPKAVANCEANITKQALNGVSAGGGPKAGIPAPTNCDHFFNP